MLALLPLPGFVSSDVFDPLEGFVPPAGCAVAAACVAPYGRAPTDGRPPPAGFVSPDDWEPSGGCDEPPDAWDPADGAEEPLDGCDEPPVALEPPGPEDSPGPEDPPGPEDSPDSEDPPDPEEAPDPVDPLGPGEPLGFGGEPVSGVFLPGAGGIGRRMAVVRSGPGSAVLPAVLPAVLSAVGSPVVSAASASLSSDVPEPSPGGSNVSFGMIPVASGSKGTSESSLSPRASGEPVVPGVVTPSLSRCLALTIMRSWTTPE
ncbi:hypothetical protein E1295_08385 [Nonomuraea mesophila]|uniref:Uncharacterized protein n=1 Tax=Nonomuraea mesophila TaxID=2530382 RepID=A0A4R5FUY4_9ACTN|nr:hypothetical protein [Nonomuraea mesophila]TDE57435.1 hypothetical protein E1295_08385 [Nonomuraea mesophila]